MLRPGSLRIDLQPDQLTALCDRLSQLHHDGRMVGRLRLGPRPAINLAALQALGQLRRQQEMVDTDAAIMFKRLSPIIPESELAALVRMQRPERVRIAETEQRPVACPRLRLKQRVMDPRGRLVAIDILWNHIEVAANQHRQILLPPRAHFFSACPSRPACRQICRFPRDCRWEDRY